MKWTKPGHEFDYMKDVILEEGVQFYIWGAAINGKGIYKSFKDELDIIGFIDIDPKKQGQTIDGVEIYHPDVLNNCHSNIRVLVASARETDIFSELKTKGFVKDVNCFTKNKFLTLYQLFKYNKLHQIFLSYSITERCTLKCKNCVGLFPYMDNPKDVPVETIMSSLKKYFNFVEKINILSLTGGDALLHKNFDLLLEKIGELYYNKKIDTIGVLTNAIIIPSKRTCELLKKYNVKVHVTDYSDATNRQKLTEIKSLLDEYDIHYDIVTHEYWLDMGYPQEKNKFSTPEEWMNLFNNCGMSCPSLYENKLFYCSPANYIDRANYCKYDEDDYLDIDKLKPEEKIKILEFSNGYCNKGYIEYCKKCNGNGSLNDNIIKAGEQI